MDMYVSYADQRLRDSGHQKHYVVSCLEKSKSPKGFFDILAKPKTGLTILGDFIEIKQAHS